MVDDKKGAYEIVNYVISMGHKNIGVITGKERSIHTHDRLLGYQKALYEIGYTACANVIEEVESDSEEYSKESAGTEKPEEPGTVVRTKEPGKTDQIRSLRFRKVVNFLYASLLKIFGSACEYGIFFKLVLPIMKPSFAAMAILNGMNCWNNFLWPLLVLRSSEKYTLPIGLNTLLTPYGNNYDRGIIFLHTSDPDPVPVFPEILY